MIGHLIAVSARLLQDLQTLTQLNPDESRLAEVEAVHHKDHTLNAPENWNDSLILSQIPDLILVSF